MFTEIRLSLRDSVVKIHSGIVKNKVYVWSNNLIKVLLFLFVATLPIYLKISNIFLGLAVVLFFITLPFTLPVYREHITPNWKKLFSSTLVLYLFVLISLIYSYDTSETMRFVEYRAAFAFFPLIFFLGFKLSRKEFELILSGLVPGVFVILLYYWGLGIYSIHDGLITWDQMSVDTLEEFDVPFKTHRTYLSFYALFSLVIVLFSKNVKYKTWFKIFMSLLIFVSIFFYESRVIVGIVMAFAIAYPFMVSRGKRLVKTAVIIYSVLLAAIMFMVAMKGHDRLLERFSKVPDEIDVSFVDGEFGYDSRASRWALAWDFIKEKPLTGYGAGCEKEVLYDSYVDNGMRWSANAELDIHNQYLSLWFDNGIFAVLFYVYMLVFMFIKSLRRGDVIMCSFVFICAVMSMFENILNVNWMITLFAFVSTAIIFDQKEDGGLFCRNGSGTATSS